ncbi:MAG: hypothetical protein ACTJG2_00010 [Candidatus Saccharimonadales bacterium]
MDITFSWGWFFGGLALIVAAAVFLRFYQWVADNFGGGVADYEHYKLYGLIAVALGFAAMLNIVPILLTFVLSMIFGRGSGGSGATLEEAAMLLQWFI